MTAYYQHMDRDALARKIEELNIPSLVSDSAFQFDAELAFERKELNELVAIWRAKTKDKAIPSRADFDARTIKPYMRNLAILDVIPQPDGSRRYRQRYEGSAIVEIFGEQTGKYLDEYMPPDRVARWVAGHDIIALSGRPLRFVINYNSPALSYLKSEVLILPLSDDGATTNMVMAFNYFGPKDP
jgi:hypothetical protein